MNESQEVHKIVNWALDRADTLNDDDSIALLEEFDEWILFEAEEIDTIDVTRITT